MNFFRVLRNMYLVNRWPVTITGTHYYYFGKHRRIMKQNRRTITLEGIKYPINKQKLINQKAR